MPKPKPKPKPKGKGKRDPWGKAGKGRGRPGADGGAINPLPPAELAKTHGKDAVRHQKALRTLLEAQVQQLKEKAQLDAGGVPQGDQKAAEFYANASGTLREMEKRGGPKKDPLLKLNEDMTGQFASDIYPDDAAFWWLRGGSNRRRATTPGAIAPMPYGRTPDRGAQLKVVPPPRDDAHFRPWSGPHWRT